MLIKPGSIRGRRIFLKAEEFQLLNELSLIPLTLLFEKVEIPEPLRPTVGESIEVLKVESLTFYNFG